MLPRSDENDLYCPAVPGLGMEDAVKPARPRPFRIEARLAVGPAGRGRGRFAERLQQHLAARRADLRQRRGGAERGRQPRPHFRAQQPLVEEAIGRKALDLLQREILSGHLEQRAHERFEPVERGFARQRVAKRLELAIGQVLATDRRVAVPAPAGAPRLESVGPAEPDVEAALDETLLVFREAGELAQLGDGQRCGPGLGHWVPRCGSRANVPDFG